MKNVLEYLEQSAQKYPDKIAVKDTAYAYTYEQLWKTARHIVTQKQIMLIWTINFQVHKILHF